MTNGISRNGVAVVGEYSSKCDISQSKWNKIEICLLFAT